jgi:hypothetical protein
MVLWGSGLVRAKLKQGRGGIGWLRSPDDDKVIRIEGAGESLHAKWVEVTDADITSSGRPLVRHCRRMLRFNAEQLW